jgi:hypothetical protein
MEGDSSQQVRWDKSRKEAYLGSRLHFLRSYYDSTITEEGFTIDLPSAASITKFARLQNPYDTAYYYFNDTTANAELWFPAKATVIYTKKLPESVTS